jgi:hypothetical protein
LDLGLTSLSTIRFAVGGVRKSAFLNDDCGDGFPQPKPRDAV